MIRADTPSGTEVVCIDAAPGPYGSGGLVKGAVYTVERVIAAIDGGFGVILAEIRPWETYAPPWGQVTVGFELKRFRYLDIPSSLLELLETAPRAAERVD